MEEVSQTRRVFLEEYRYGLKQLRVASILMKQRQQLSEEKISSEDDAVFHEHIGDLLAASVEALDCFCAE